MSEDNRATRARGEQERYWMAYRCPDCYMPAEPVRGRILVVHNGWCDLWARLWTQHNGLAKQIYDFGRSA